MRGDGQQQSVGLRAALLSFDGDFLEFGWRLAADAVAGLQGFKIADLAKVADAIELAVAHSKEVVYLERAIDGPLAFDADFSFLKPLVLKRVKQPGGTRRKRIVPIFDPQDGPDPR